VKVEVTKDGHCRSEEALTGSVLNSSMRVD
jgi:hypothetical protein